MDAVGKEGGESNLSSWAPAAYKAALQNFPISQPGSSPDRHGPFRQTRRPLFTPGCQVLVNATECVHEGGEMRTRPL